MAAKFKNLFKEEDDNEIIGDDEFYNGAGSDSGEGAPCTNNMIILEPRAFSEAQQIVDYLKNRNSVVVNFKRITTDQAKRIIDFLSGCIYAINGSMQKIGSGIYVCAPKNVTVQGEISPEGAGTKAKAKENKDEIDW